MTILIIPRINTVLIWVLYIAFLEGINTQYTGIAWRKLVRKSTEDTTPCPPLLSPASSPLYTTSVPLTNSTVPLYTFPCMNNSIIVKGTTVVPIDSSSTPGISYVGGGVQTSDGQIFASPASSGIVGIVPSLITTSTNQSIQCSTNDEDIVQLNNQSYSYNTDKHIYENIFAQRYGGTPFYAAPTVPSSSSSSSSSSSVPCSSMMGIIGGTLYTASTYGRESFTATYSLAVPESNGLVWKTYPFPFHTRGAAALWVNTTLYLIGGIYDPIAVPQFSQDFDLEINSPALLKVPIDTDTCLLQTERIEILDYQNTFPSMLRDRAFMVTNYAPLRKGGLLYGGCRGTEPGTVISFRCSTDLWFLPNIEVPSTWFKASIQIFTDTNAGYDTLSAMVMELPINLNISGRVLTELIPNSTLDNIYGNTDRYTNIPADVLTPSTAPVATFSPSPTPSPKDDGWIEPVPIRRRNRRIEEHTDTNEETNPIVQPEQKSNRKLQSVKDLPNGPTAVLLIVGTHYMWSMDGSIWYSLKAGYLPASNSLIATPKDRWRTKGLALYNKHPYFYGGIIPVIQTTDNVLHFYGFSTNGNIYDGVFADCLPDSDSSLCMDTDYVSIYSCTAWTYAIPLSSSYTESCKRCPTCGNGYYQAEPCRPGVPFSCSRCTAATAFRPECTTNITSPEDEIVPSSSSSTIEKGLWPSQPAAAAWITVSVIIGVIMTICTIIFGISRCLPHSSVFPNKQNNYLGNSTNNATMTHNNNGGGPVSLHYRVASSSSSIPLLSLKLIYNILTPSVVFSIVNFTVHIIYALIVIMDPRSQGINNYSLERYGSSIVFYVLAKNIAAIFGGIIFAYFEKRKEENLYPQTNALVISSKATTTGITVNPPIVQDKPHVASVIDYGNSTIQQHSPTNSIALGYYIYAAYIYIILHDSKLPSIVVSFPINVKSGSTVLAATLIVSTFSILLPIVLLDCFVTYFLIGRVYSSWVLLPIIATVCSIVECIFAMNGFLSHATTIGSRGPIRSSHHTPRHNSHVLRNGRLDTNNGQLYGIKNNASSVSTNNSNYSTENDDTITDLRSNNPLRKGTSGNFVPHSPFSLHSAHDIDSATNNNKNHDEDNLSSDTVIYPTDGMLNSPRVISSSLNPNSAEGNIPRPVVDLTIDAGTVPTMLSSSSSNPYDEYHYQVVNHPVMNYRSNNNGNNNTRLQRVVNATYSTNNNSINHLTSLSRSDPITNMETDGIHNVVSTSPPSSSLMITLTGPNRSLFVVNPFSNLSNENQSSDSPDGTSNRDQSDDNRSDIGTEISAPQQLCV